jgi:hypothetical protein
MWEILINAVELSTQLGWGSENQETLVVVQNSLP